MIVFVASMPRAGSMWLYNITRAILDRAKRRVLPQLMPPNSAELIAAALSSAPNDAEVYCIKTHHALATRLDTGHQLRFLCSYRDVRDAMLSYMRFTHADFGTGVRVMKQMMEHTDYYLQSFPSDTLPIEYRSIVASPADVVSDIATFVGSSVSPARARSIADDFARERIKRMIGDMDKVRVDRDGEIRGAKNKARYLSVPNEDGTTRVYDKRTAFQTNHITASRDGEWREAFNDVQRRVVKEIAGPWLERYGFPPD